MLVSYDMLILQSHIMKACPTVDSVAMKATLFLTRFVYAVRKSEE